MAFISAGKKEKSPTVQSYDILQPILATRASGSLDCSAKQNPERHQMITLHILTLSHMTYARYVLWIDIKAMRYENSKASFRKYTFSTILCDYFFFKQSWQRQIITNSHKYTPRFSSTPRAMKAIELKVISKHSVYYEFLVNLTTLSLKVTKSI